MGPISQSDGHDRLWLIDELVPGLATGLDDGVVIFEDAVREPILAEVLPDVLDRVQLGGARGQQDDGEVFRNLELAGAVPTGAVHQDDAMGLGSDVAADFVEMHLHGAGVGDPKRSAWLTGVSEGLMAEVDQLGPDWNPPEPEELSLLGFLGRRANGDKVKSEQTPRGRQEMWSSD